MDINVLYPPLDVYLDYFEFTILSTTFITQQEHQFQQGLAPPDVYLIAHSITDLYTKSSQLKYKQLMSYDTATGSGCPTEVTKCYLD